MKATILSRANPWGENVLLRGTSGVLAERRNVEC